MADNSLMLDWSLGQGVCPNCGDQASQRNAQFMASHPLKKGDKIIHSVQLEKEGKGIMTAFLAKVTLIVELAQLPQISELAIEIIDIEIRRNQAGETLYEVTFRTKFTTDEMLTLLEQKAAPGADES